MRGACPRSRWASACVPARTPPLWSPFPPAVYQCKVALIAKGLRCLPILSWRLAAVRQLGELAKIAPPKSSKKSGA